MDDLLAMDGSARRSRGRTCARRDGERRRTGYHKWFLGPTRTGDDLNLPMSLQLTEALRAMGVDEF